MGHGQDLLFGRGRRRQVPRKSGTTSRAQRGRRPGNLKVLTTNPLALERAGKGGGILARRGALQSLEASRREEVSAACENPLSLVDVGDR